MVAGRLVNSLMLFKRTMFGLYCKCCYGCWKVSFNFFVLKNFGIATRPSKIVGPWACTHFAHSVNLALILFQNIAKNPKILRVAFSEARDLKHEKKKEQHPKS